MLIVVNLWERAHSKRIFSSFSVQNFGSIGQAVAAKIEFLFKQAQEGNSRVRLEMTNKRAKTCLNVENVKEC